MAKKEDNQKVLRDKLKTLDAFKTEELPNPCNVKSRLNYPVTISYNGEALVIPPRGNCKVADRNKIGAIPKGVVII